MKFIVWTGGQISQLLFSAPMYLSSSLFRGLAPSRYAMLLRKNPKLSDAKMHWSARTRATVVRYLFERLIRVRTLYHCVAAGPKTTVESIDKH